MEDYDVVVIGAGNGGMTASAALAQKGLRVLLLERHNVPGGAATTFCRGRFEFEISLHMLSCLGPPEKPGPVRIALEGLGVLDDLEFVDIRDIGRIILPGRLDVALKTEKAQVVDELQRAFPNEKEAIARYFDFVDLYCTEFFGAYFLNDPDVTREKYPLLFRYGFKSYKQVLDEFFSDPLLKSALGLFWILVGLPPSRLHFSTMVMTFWLSFEYGLHHVIGGSQSLSNAIVNKFISHGGTARFRCGAKKIIVEDGAVKGVVTEDGDSITTKCVLSNASTVTTYADLIGREHTPAGVFEDLKRCSLGPSALILFVGLDCRPAEVGITESMNCLLAHTDIDERPLNEMRQLEVTSDVTGFSCFEVANPDLSPPGTCQLNMVTLKYAEPWLRVPASQYARVKYECAEAMLGRLEEALPGIRSHIEEVEVATPLTFMRYLGHPQGAVYGFHRYTKDIPFTKASSFRPGSDVHGLYFAGAWVGDLGYPATYLSGLMAAEAIANEWKT